MNWFFPKRSSKAAEPRPRFRPGVETLECRTMPAATPLATTTAVTAKPVTVDATVRTLDSALTPTKSIDAAVGQFARFSPNQLQQLDKGLQAVEMIAHLSDLFGMMADHMKAGAGLGFDLGVGQSHTSVATNVANLFTQLQKSMSGPDFSDLLKQVAGPASPLPALPGDQMKAAQANLMKAFETVDAALAALGVRDVRVVMNGGSGGGDGPGAWGAFIHTPGTSGDNWSFLLSIPGLPQQDAKSLLDQWKPGVDPRTASDVSDALNGWAGCVADWSVTTVAIGGTIGGMIAETTGIAVGAGLGAMAAAGWCTGVSIANWAADHVIPEEPKVVPASNSGGSGSGGTSQDSGSTSGSGSTPTNDPKTNPAPDGVGVEKYDPYWGWINPIAVNPATGVADPPDEFEEEAFDMARLVRGVVAAAMSKVNPNPEGSTGGSGSGGTGGTVTGGPFGGIVGGDPSDDQPVIYTDTSPGGNPIIMFFPPKTPGVR